MSLWASRKTASTFGPKSQNPKNRCGANMPKMMNTDHGMCQGIPRASDHEMLFAGSTHPPAPKVTDFRTSSSRWNLAADGRQEILGIWMGKFLFWVIRKRLSTGADKWIQWKLRGWLTGVIRWAAESSGIQSLCCLCAIHLIHIYEWLYDLVKKLHSFRAFSSNRNPKKQALKPPANSFPARLFR